MKATVTQTMIVPRYLAHFRCLGPNCPSTCCTGWRVTIDKQTFQHYRSTTDSTLAPLFKRSLQRNRQARHAREFAAIRHDAGRGCPLQDDNGLCLVHQRLGEAALSDTCQAYPRQSQYFAGHYEQVLTLSCPEAARLALLSEDAFHFEAMPLATRSHIIAAAGRADIDGDHQCAARAWVMQLLHTEALPIAERLAMLGLLCDQLNALPAGERGAGVPALLAQMTMLVESQELTATLAALPLDHAAQVARFGMFLCHGHARTEVPAVNAIMREVVAGFGANDAREADFETVVDHYVRGRAWLDATDTFNAVMSRYFLNEAVRENFPWKDASPLAQHRRWIVFFGVLRMMLAGRAHHLGRSLEGQEIGDVIWAFCRQFQHSPSFAEQVEAILAGCQMDSLPPLLALLK